MPATSAGMTMWMGGALGSPSSWPGLLFDPSWSGLLPDGRALFASSWPGFVPAIHGLEPA